MGWVRLVSWLFDTMPESSHLRNLACRDHLIDNPKHRIARITVLALVLCPILALSAVAAPKFNARAFNAKVTRAMSAWRVPGLAVAAIHDGRLVHMKAYGVADIDTKRPTTAATLFAVGSITKSFTATLLAMLAEEGRLDWDRPVTTYLSDFKLMDQEATRTVTVRDFLTHRTGMPRHDVLWYAGAFGRRDMIRRLRHLKPTKKPREVFQYNNLMYMAAGHVAGRVGGASWEELTKLRLLRPLGMRSSKTGFVGFLLSRDRASPYFGAIDSRVQIALRNTDQIGPAASIYSNVEDMAQYLRFHLQAGEILGKRILSRAGAAQLYTEQVTVPRRPRFSELGNPSYGMGFYVSRYRGRKLVFHPGFIDGYGGLMAIFPEEKIGIVVLSNLSGHNPVPKIIARLLYDRILGLKPVPWLERFLGIETARRRARERRARISVASRQQPSAELSAPPPRRRPLTTWDLAGTYDHPGYGPIQIWADVESLSGRFHSKVFPLVRLDGDTWHVPETTWPLRAGLRLRFLTNEKGEVDRLATPIADGPTYPFKVGDVEFIRRRNRETTR